MTSTTQAISQMNDPRPIFGIFTKALIIHNRRVLIMKRSSQASSGHGEWDIPGGGMEFNETVLDCLHREIMEETGLTANVDRLLYATTAATPTRTSKGWVGLVYLCHTNSDAVTLSHEHTEYLWATKSQLIDSLTHHTLNNYTNNGVFDLLNID